MIPSPPNSLLAPVPARSAASPLALLLAVRAALAALAVLAAPATFVAGCAAHRPPPQDVDARDARSEIEERERSQAMQRATAARRSELAEEANRLEKADDEAALDARPLSERSAKLAVDRLRTFAAIREDAHGMTLRIDESVLFEGSTSELMTTARERLDRVAQALHETRARSIVVRGYMDRTSDALHDSAVSRRRADTVRAYLVSRGVHADSIRAEGRAKLAPLANIAMSEGQSEDRRIELVVDGVPDRGAGR